MAPNDSTWPPKLAKTQAQSNPKASDASVNLEGQKNESGGKEKKTLKQIAEEKLKTNPSQLGDPISLKAETSDSHPTDQDRGASKVDKSKL